jgi:hypothetical protein
MRRKDVAREVRLCIGLLVIAQFWPFCLSGLHSGHADPVARTLKSLFIRGILNLAHVCTSDDYLNQFHMMNLHINIARRC